MNVRVLTASLIAAAAVWSSGDALAQDAPPGQQTIQAEADRLEAAQADLDRVEAERADEAMRERERLERRERRRQAAEDRTRFASEEYRDWSACLLILPDQQATMIKQLLAQHELAVASLRDSAGPGADISQAIARQVAIRDEMVKAIAGETCG